MYMCTLSLFSFGMVRGTILSDPQLHSEPLWLGLFVLTNSQEASRSPVQVSGYAGCLG